MARKFFITSSDWSHFILPQIWHLKLCLLDERTLSWQESWAQSSVCIVNAPQIRTVHEVETSCEYVGKSASWFQLECLPWLWHSLCQREETLLKPEANAGPLHQLQNLPPYQPSTEEEGSCSETTPGKCSLFFASKLVEMVVANYTRDSSTLYYERKETGFEQNFLCICISPLVWTRTTERWSSTFSWGPGG